MEDKPLLLVEKRQEELRGQERKKRTYTKQKSLFLPVFIPMVSPEFLSKLNIMGGG